MCGISGIIGADDEDLVARMLRRLVHRGPDEAGLHREPGVTLGARRLRVIDPAGGSQPVRNETGSVWAVMNGELYNYRELREGLLKRGHRLSSQGDTEVLAHLYEDEGMAFVSRLRGMYACAIWDRERQEALLLRDPLGIKPLYYAVLPASGSESVRVAFSSELPSLLEAVPDARLRLDAIADYLAHLYVPGPETIYEGVYQLRPGEGLRVGQGRLEVFRHYRPEDVAADVQPFTKGETEARVLDALRDSVRTHLVSDVPVGLFLSGGVDSAALLALMSEQGPVNTFSIGYDDPADRSYNELVRARLAATHFGSSHTEALLRPDIGTLMPRVVAAMGEPFADSSAIPTYLISEVARRSVTVALSGIGGDELFGGYPRYLGIRAAGSYQMMPNGIRSWLSSRGAAVCRENGSGRDYVGRLGRFLCDGHRELGEQYRRWTTFIPVEWETSLWNDEMAAALPYPSTITPDTSLFDQWPSDHPADRAMGLDLRTYLPDDLLRMGDRMSMAHSLELRVPFCDRDLLATALRIPAERRLAGWHLKSCLKSTLRGVLPSAILDAPKQGFMIPLARWLREDVREMAQDLLSDGTIRRRGYLKPAYARWLLNEHLSRRRNFSDQIYALMVLELWHEQRTPASAQSAIAVEAL